MTSFFDNNPRFKKYLFRLAYFFLGVLALILVISVGLKVYFESNKAEIIQKLNVEINDNIDGKIHIGDINFKFFSGFPNFTLALQDVEVKDKLWDKHKRTFLKAGEIQTRIRLIGILRKKINIREIVIKDAKINVFVDKNGISNSNIFKPKPKEEKAESGAEIKLGKIILKDVVFISENQKRNKLFHFDIASFQSKFIYNENNEDFEAKIDLKILAKSMAFNTLKGSFISNKMLKGDLVANFSKENKKIIVNSKDLKIGEDTFDILAVFNLGGGKAIFFFDINTYIKWRNASNLLSKNINAKLNKFNLLEPLKINCTLNGNLNVPGEPKIMVKAEVRNNELSIPDGIVKKCSFNAEFINHFEKGKKYGDPNSAITLTNFSGTYKNVPFRMSVARINNFKKPIATGKLNSEFELTQLKDLVNEQFISFQKGKASVNLDFKVDIVDLQLKKPYYIGGISVTDASFRYEPKNLAIKNTDVLLSFTPTKFSLQKLRLQKSKNIINMDFTIDNYLNLYYDDPSKILINWNIYCPYVDVKDLLGFFVSPKKKLTPKKENSGEVSGKVYTILDKSQMVLNLKADKIKFNHLTGSGAKALIVLKDNVLTAKNGRVATADGTVTFEGMLTTTNRVNQFSSKVEVSKVDISEFLVGFDNFGIKSFKPQSIRGNLNLKADLKGNISSKGEMIENSLNGNIEFNVKDGALVNFEPMKNLGKFIVNRNFDNITLYELGSKMNANGGKVNMDYFKLTTSVINLDMSGVYSFDKGTNLAITIPLRNPKDDYKIKNKAERDKLRYTGTILRLRALDVNGKTKLKLETNPK